LAGGTDLDCGAVYGEQIVTAVNRGLVTVAEVDRALERVYTGAIKLGVFDNPAAGGQDPYGVLGPADVDTQAHRDLALLAAQESLVLLKNDGGVLPLPATAPTVPHAGERAAKQRRRRIAIIGPHANSTTDLLGNPGYRGTSRYIFGRSPLDELRRRFAHGEGNSDSTTEVLYAGGCPISHPGTEAGIAAAAAVAATADVVLLFVGINSEVEDESLDRVGLGLPGDQPALVAAVLERARGPVVAVLINGGAVAVPQFKHSAKVPAVLEAFYPGQAGAAAIFSAIFGEFSPAGRLPVTVYNTDLESRRSIRDMNLRANGGITYMFYRGVPLWEFGEGLTYTTFRTTWSPSPPVQSDDGGVGGTAGARVGRTVVNPVRSKVAHAAGTDKPAAPATVTITVTTDEMATAAPLYFSSRGTASSPAVYNVTVTNIGAVASSATIVGFVSSSPTVETQPRTRHAAAADRARERSNQPIRRLFDFGRTRVLSPGESAVVHLSVPAQVLAEVDPSGAEVLVPGRHRIEIGAGDPAEQALFGTLEVTGGSVELV
jgi:hypothetical protein